ncbi:efflux RND transporter periplasmic adaptor subunit [Acinetobacter baretiae]|uniref:efflux RND transporter periplasmic adaptor subunit n=1 Tax=Acinetobacter baretiae TaxID=2605383 RepID=UPI001F429D91|nr:efflux RND transporter periplasmic adaptor subunit [Acinetobacter baretiae]
MSGRIKTIVWFAVVVVVCAGIYFYFKLQPSKNEKANMKFNRDTPVQVGVVSLQDVPVQLNALGTVVADKTVTVTSRITGHLQQVYFQEGQYVKQGQLLAQIDVQPYQATLEQYQGTLSESQAQLKNAQLMLARYQRLYAKDSIAKQDLDTQTATTTQYQGAVKSAEGQIKSAALNIQYGRITAPISGYIGLRKIDVGNTVSADSTSIAVITQMQPMAVTFNIPQINIAHIIQPLRQGHALSVDAFDQAGAQRIAEGQVKVISNEIDSTTGTVMLKAMFDNKDNVLFPNQFVNIKLKVNTLKDAMTVPSAAVQIGTGGKYVFVIDDQSIAQKVTVSTGPETTDGQVVILNGLSVGQKVVTSGVNALGNGSKVNIVTPEKVDVSVLDAAKQHDHNKRPR